MTVCARGTELGAALRTAFAAELGERLPALRTALAGGPTGDARRAAHSLGSSAFVIGEPALALLARDVEARLDSERTWHEQARQLLQALEGWRP